MHVKPENQQHGPTCTFSLHMKGKRQKHLRRQKKASTLDGSKIVSIPRNTATGRELDLRVDVERMQRDIGQLRDELKKAQASRAASWERMQQPLAEAKELFSTVTAKADILTQQTTAAKSQATERHERDGKQRHRRTRTAFEPSTWLATLHAEQAAVDALQHFIARSTRAMKTDTTRSDGAMRDIEAGLQKLEDRASDLDQRLAAHMKAQARRRMLDTSTWTGGEEQQWSRLLEQHKKHLVLVARAASKLAAYMRGSGSVSGSGSGTECELDYVEGNVGSAIRATSRSNTGVPAEATSSGGTHTANGTQGHAPMTSGEHIRAQARASVQDQRKCTTSVTSVRFSMDDQRQGVAQKRRKQRKPSPARVQFVRRTLQPLSKPESSKSPRLLGHTRDSAGAGSITETCASKTTESKARASLLAPQHFHKGGPWMRGWMLAKSGLLFRRVCRVPSCCGGSDRRVLLTVKGTQHNLIARARKLLEETDVLHDRKLHKEVWGCQLIATDPIHGHRYTVVVRPAQLAALMHPVPTKPCSRSMSPSNTTTTADTAPVMPNWSKLGRVSRECPWVGGRALHDSWVRAFAPLLARLRWCDSQPHCGSVLVGDMASEDRASASVPTRADNCAHVAKVPTLMKLCSCICYRRLRLPLPATFIARQKMAVAAQTLSYDVDVVVLSDMPNGLRLLGTPLLSDTDGEVECNDTAQNTAQMRHYTGYVRTAELATLMCQRSRRNSGRTSLSSAPEATIHDGSDTDNVGECEAFALRMLRSAGSNALELGQAVLDCVALVDIMLHTGRRDHDSNSCLDQPTRGGLALRIPAHILDSTAPIADSAVSESQQRQLAYDSGANILASRARVNDVANSARKTRAESAEVRAAAKERQRAQDELDRLRDLRDHANGFAAGHKKVQVDVEGIVIVDHQGNVDVDTRKGSAHDTGQDHGFTDSWDLLSAADAVTPLRNVGQSAYLAAIRKHEHATLTNGCASWSTAPGDCADKQVA